MDIPLEELKGLLTTLEEGGVEEFEFEDEKHRVRVAFRRGAGVPAGAPFVMTTAPATPSMVPSVAPPAAPPRQEDDANVVYVTSPFVGTFYRASAPEAEPFVQVGAPVAVGQVLCIVEAMKLMNEIEAEQSGTLLEILAANGDSVEFGQRLFKMRKG